MVTFIYLQVMLFMRLIKAFEDSVWKLTAYQLTYMLH